MAKAKARVKAKTKKANPRGRPSPYRPEYAEQAAKLCELGATDIEVADFFKVDTRTLYRWKHTHDEFCQALVVGKDKADDRVERSLYARATGYSFDSEKVFQFQGEIIRAPIREHVPPDPGSAFSWLKNRRGSVWRDKIEHDHIHGGAINVTVTPDDLKTL